MGAWVNSALDLTFDGVIDENGDIIDAGDDPIADLSMVYAPN